MESSNFKNDIFNKNKNLRDYDKEPLVLRDYSGFPIGFHHLGILIFWISASVFCISCLDDFERGNLDINSAKQTLIKFIFFIIGFLIVDYFNIINSKKKYITCYTSKVAYCDENFKEIDSKNLLHNGTVVRQMWFLGIIFSTTFCKFFLAIILIANFLKGTFETVFLGVLLCILILFIAESAQEIDWYDSRKFYTVGLYSIHLFCFNENDYKQVRDYIMAIFHVDINKNLSEQQFQKFFQ